MTIRNKAMVYESAEARETQERDSNSSKEVVKILISKCKKKEWIQVLLWVK